MVPRYRKNPGKISAVPSININAGSCSTSVAVFFCDIHHGRDCHHGVVPVCQWLSQQSLWSSSVSSSDRPRRDWSSCITNHHHFVKLATSSSFHLFIYFFVPCFRFHFFGLACLCHSCSRSRYVRISLVLPFPFRLFLFLIFSAPQTQNCSINRIPVGYMRVRTDTGSVIWCGCGGRKRFRTAVPFWGQTTWSLGGLFPQWDCSSKRVNVKAARTTSSF